MRPIVTDRIAWCVSLSVCHSVGQSLSVMIVSPAEMYEPIEIPFGMWTRVGETPFGCGLG